MREVPARMWLQAGTAALYRRSADALPARYVDAFTALPLSHWLQFSIQSP